MLKRKIAELAIFAVMALPWASSWAQEAPASGLYRIDSGDYGAWYELFGPPYIKLPNASQSYIELVADAQRNLVQMAILSNDLHTVSAAPGFMFFFTNGVVFSDHIQFTSENPSPDEPSWGYTISNFAGGLRMDGAVEGPSGPQYVPTLFEHENVVAVLVAAVPEPKLSISRASADGAIRLTVMDGLWGQTNVIEASTDLITWTAISTNIFPSTVCPACPYIEFQEPANRARRFYRSFSLP